MCEVLELQIGNNFLLLQWKEILCGKVLVKYFDTIIRFYSDIKLSGTFKM